MNNNWIKPNLRKPPQGKKVLCCSKGDISIRQRFADYWFPIPYVDSKFADIKEPELWQEIDFPGDLTGYLRVFWEGILYNMDEFEKVNPSGYNEMINGMLANYNQYTREL